MSVRHSIVLAIFAAIILTLGSRWLLCAETPTQTSLTCRPSAPSRAATVATTPVVLFWGNSLAFDNGWDRTGQFFAINCAVQGQTAATALSRTPNLPGVAPYAVVLIFGSVELLQDKADPAAFRTALVGIIAHLERKYPAAKIIVAGISHGLDAWRYDNDAAEALNNVLRNLSGTEYLDTAALLAPLSAADITYDGVHLTRDSYAILERALVEMLDWRP